MNKHRKARRAELNRRKAARRDMEGRKGPRQPRRPIRARTARRALAREIARIDRAIQRARPPF